MDKAELAGSFPLGVSNQFQGQEATVTVEKGSLLLLWEERGDLYSLLPRLWMGQRERSNGAV